MTGTVIPLRSDRCATTAPTAFDVTAVELLREGRAATLLGARFAAIRADLLVKREQLVAVITDLHARPPSGNIHVDAVNATLWTEASTGLTYVDQFLAQVETSAARVERERVPYP